MEQHLPVLAIVVPLIAAPLCVLIRQRTLVFGTAITVCWATFAMTVLLLLRVVYCDGGDLTTPTANEVTYQMGGWLAPWGIEYRIDSLSVFMLVIVAGIGAGVLSNRVFMV